MKLILVVVGMLVTAPLFADDSISLQPGSSVTVNAGQNVQVSCAATPSRPICTIFQSYGGGYEVEIGDHVMGNQSFQTLELAGSEIKILIADGVCQ